MAGVKVTDLTPLGTAAIDDVMYIVDTSSNQSKQIEVQNIYSGMPQFESGSYTPTVSGENNCSNTSAEGIYSRVGNVVTVSLRIETTLDLGETDCSFNLSPPIATDFQNLKSFFATLGSNIGDVYGYVQSDDTFDQLSIYVYSPTTQTVQYIYFTGQYVIV